MPGGRPKGSKEHKPRSTAARRLYADLVGTHHGNPQWSPMAVVLYAMSRSFAKARAYEQEAAELESELELARASDPEAPETEVLAARAETTDSLASEWFDNAVSKAVQIAPYVHPKLVAQPAEAPKVGNPNALSDAELARIAAAENAATGPADA